MRIARTAKNPVVLSYLALRKGVGFVAFGLPFAVSIPYWLAHYALQSSISGYYYTGTRNLFVGSLCAISMFMLGCRGYDRRDEIAGLFSAICALGVAFFPTAPDCCATHRQQVIGDVHYTFAAMLFLTLAYFCLFLFRMTAEGKEITREKRARNRIYLICGWTIIASIALILALVKGFKRQYLFGQVGTAFCFESTALLAFGTAWMVKGETFLKDAVRPARNETSDRIATLATSPAD